MKIHTDSIHKKKHSILRSIVIFFLATIIVLSTIFATSTNITDQDRYRIKLLKRLESDTDFSDFETDLFKYEVTANSVTTAYSLHYPEKYNITNLSPRLTDFSYKDYENDRKKKISKDTVAQILHKLKSFDKNSLDFKEQITYDILYNHLNLCDDFTNYSYYETLLGKTTGASASIPVTLSEYPLNTVSDIETYLSLLQQIPEYFDSVMKYEDKKSSLHIKTPDFILNETKNELSQFIKSLKNDNNCFVTTFYERTKNTSNLSQKDRSKYISKNKYYVNQYIIPAYENLIKYLSDKTSKSKDKDIKPQPNTSYGLSYNPKGKEYYELVVKESTGSFRPISEMINMTEDALSNALSDVLYIATTNTDAYMYYCDHPVETGYSSPEGILDALSLMIREEYPILDTPPSYKIKTVPESLSSMVSPAYYMIPAIDDYNNNTIYINPLYTSEQNGNLFTTLAHEGFPGHLYQTVYYNNSHPSPLRQILDYPGYVEGWATYVELNSFKYINYPNYSDSLPILYKNDAIINLALSSRIDIGVNYENWTLNDTCKFFEDLGFNSYYASEIYSYVVEAPGNYLSYFIGYLEIENLKQEYRNLKMEKYTDKDFHKALLDIGPADFDTIRKYLLQ